MAKNWREELTVLVSGQAQHGLSFLSPSAPFAFSGEGFDSLGSPLLAEDMLDRDDNVEMSNFSLSKSVLMEYIAT